MGKKNYLIRDLKILICIHNNNNNSSSIIISTRNI